MSARCLETSVLAARDNVIINLSTIVDEQFKTQTEKQVADLVETARQQCKHVLALLDQRAE